jgi:hypothetical protein
MTSFDRTGLTHDDLPIDAEICTSDGDKIGTVREVHDDFFKVDAAMQPDYWLPMHCISSVSGNRVFLTFHKDHLGEYKTDNPLAA